MDICHRLARIHRRPPLRLSHSLRLLLAGGLALAGGAAYGAGVEEETVVTEVEQQLDGEVSEPLPIIVTLAADDDAGAVAVARTQVMDRLREVMPADDFAAVTTYGNFPLIALSADRDLIVLLLEMQEVAFIERDREFMRQDDASANF